MVVAPGDQGRALDPVILVALRRALRRALAGPATSGPGGNPAELSQADQMEFMRAVSRHRVAGVLADSDVVVDLPSPTRAALAAAARRQRLAAMMVAQETISAVGVLTSAGIRSLVVKGVALAAQAHGDFAARGNGDVDVLVTSSDVPLAARVLADAGWVWADPTMPRPGPGWRWRYTRWVSHEFLVERRGGPLAGRAVDLHWGLSQSKDSTPSFDELWGRRVDADVDGRQVPTLSPVDAMAHACEHSWKHRWETMLHLVDIHRLLQRHGAVVARSGNVRSRAAVSSTLGVTSWAVGLPPNAASQPPCRPQDTRLAAVAQSEPPGGPWCAPRSRWLASSRRRMGLPMGFRDRSRAVAMAVLPPNSLVDASGGFQSPGTVAASRAVALLSRGDQEGRRP